jgi:hypothetical protein
MMSEFSMTVKETINYRDHRTRNTSTESDVCHFVVVRYCGCALRRFEAAAACFGDERNDQEVGIGGFELRVDVEFAPQSPALQKSKAARGDRQSDGRISCQFSTEYVGGNELWFDCSISSYLFVCLVPFY